MATPFISVEVTEEAAALTVGSPTSVSVNLTDEVTRTYENTVAFPSQANNSAEITFPPARYITATNVQDAILQLAANTYRQATAPSGSDVEKGDIWYETDTEDLYVYREVSSGSFEWSPILLGNSVIDGGTL